MKKTDIHVLNWEKITQNTSEQSNNKTVNKGILFEDLIEKLLTAMFPKEISILMRKIFRIRSGLNAKITAVIYL